MGGFHQGLSLRWRRAVESMALLALIRVPDQSFGRINPDQSNDSCKQQQGYGRARRHDSGRRRGAHHEAGLENGRQDGCPCCRIPRHHLGQPLSEAAENLLEKLKSLPPQRQAEVADVVDVLRVREEKTRTRRMDGFAAAQPPLSPEDIQAEIAAARAQQRAANADRR